MKKTLFIVSVLLVAVVSTACINNFAVRDLNNKAQSYMQQGDYPQAIERLKSSEFQRLPAADTGRRVSYTTSD